MKRRCEVSRCGLRAAVWVAAALVGGGLHAEEDAWTQFRGGEGKGRSLSARGLPDEIGPDRNVVWKVAVPAGHSSPVLHAGRIFLTGSREGKLLAFAVNAADGKLLWEREAPYKSLEPIHRIGSHAQSTPAVDAEGVTAFFGSCGLFRWDLDGKLLWKVEMGPFPNDFGAAASPLLYEDAVILVQDHDVGSFLAAYDRKTGALRWKTDRGEFPRNFSTPVLWKNAGRTDLVVAGTLRVTGYDPTNGRERWTVRGISRTVCSTPTVGDDGRLYLATWAAGGDAGERFDIEKFAVVLPQFDKNKNGQLEEEELPSGAVKQRFSQVDRDKSLSVSAEEYEFFRTLAEKSQNVTLAVNPGPEGEATATHVAWTFPKFSPFCASPVFVDGRLYTLKDGGILNCLNAADGTVVKTGRLPGTKSCYASPIAGDGKLFCCDEAGTVSIVRTGQTWSVLSSADFGESIYATPALLGDRLYLRTSGHLYCFSRTAARP